MMGRSREGDFFVEHTIVSAANGHKGSNIKAVMWLIG
ncbi:hypothetical protein AGRO_1239 [Agrobacterium sp. ATCC 31749]|jgi:hypothetical protein|nr:hypothetical protein AGRO_1239 [Agrobacterium sp. ATCC 31749]